MAGLGEAGDDLGEDVGVQSPGSEVVEKKKGACAGDGDVVDAVVDEVLADGVVAAGQEGKLEFCADAIDACDEHGVFHSAEVRAEEPAEAPNFPEDLRAVGLGDHLLDALFDGVAEGEVHACGCVGGFGRLGGRFHRQWRRKAGG